MSVLSGLSLRLQAWQVAFFVFPKATVFYFSVLDKKKIQNLMKEGGKKKHLRKKNIQRIFEKRPNTIFFNLF